LITILCILLEYDEIYYKIFDIFTLSVKFTEKTFARTKSQQFLLILNGLNHKRRQWI